MSKVSILALGPINPPVQWVLGALCRGGEGGVKIEVPEGTRDLSHVQSVHTSSGAHQSTYSMGTRFSLLVGGQGALKWVEYEAHHSLPSTSEDKADWCLTSPQYAYMGCTGTT